MHWLCSSTCVINIVSELKSSSFIFESKNSWNLFHDFHSWMNISQRKDKMQKIRCKKYDKCNPVGGWQALGLLDRQPYSRIRISAVLTFCQKKTCLCYYIGVVPPGHQIVYLNNLHTCGKPRNPQPFISIL